MLYYFAYGSNLHPVRLAERVSSAKLFGISLLDGYRIEFHKLSHDGSGKCNLYYTGKESDVVHGAIYTMNPEHKDDLDRYENRGAGYIDTQVCLRHGDDYINCFTYIAQPAYIDPDVSPYHWYKELVVSGARYLELPDSYIKTLLQTNSIDDPDRLRRDDHASLLKRISCY